MWPSEDSYVRLFRNPAFETHLCETLREGTAERIRGAVFFQRGSFGMVFRLVHPHYGALACKVFYEQSVQVVDPAEIVERYRAISELISANRERLDLLMPVMIFEEGLKVGELFVPMIATSWVEGQPINEYVEDRLIADSGNEDDNPSNFSGVELAAQFAHGILQMERLGIAHGDICPANLLVAAPEVRLRLIDYDNMFVPELIGRRRLSAGSVAYLSLVEDGDRPFGPDIDRDPVAILLAHLFFLDAGRWTRYPGRRPWLLDLEKRGLIAELRGCAGAWKAILDYHAGAVRSINKAGPRSVGLGDFLEGNPNVANTFRRLRRNPQPGIERPGLAAPPKRGDWQPIGGARLKPVSRAEMPKTERAKSSAIVVVAQARYAPREQSVGANSSVGSAKSGSEAAVLVLAEPLRGVTSDAASGALDAAATKSGVSSPVMNVFPQRSAMSDAPKAERTEHPARVGVAQMTHTAREQPANAGSSASVSTESGSNTALSSVAESQQRTTPEAGSVAVDIPFVGLAVGPEVSVSPGPAVTLVDVKKEAVRRVVAVGLNAPSAAATPGIATRAGVSDEVVAASPERSTVSPSTVALQQDGLAQNVLNGAQPVSAPNAGKKEQGPLLLVVVLAVVVVVVTLIAMALAQVTR